MDPESIVWHERADLPDSVRLRAVAILLARADANVLREPEYGLWRSLARLKHVQLASQLREALTNKTVSDDSRELALRIAQATSQDGLDELALSIALDDANSHRLRVEAARTVEYTGSDSTRRRLRPLACVDDPSRDEQLRGAALSAAWRTLTPRDLFAAIRARKNDSFYGSYAHALSTIAENLTETYAPAALAWLLAEIDGQNSIDRRVHDAAALLVLKAGIASTDMVRGFARLVIRSARVFRSVWADSRSDVAREGLALLAENVALRRNLLKAVATLGGSGRKRPDLPAQFDSSHLLAALQELGVRWTSGDVQWALELLDGKSLRPGAAAVLLRFVEFATSWTDATSVSVLWPYRFDKRFAEVFRQFPTAATSPEGAIREFAQRRVAGDVEWNARRSSLQEERRLRELASAGLPAASLEARMSEALRLARHKDQNPSPAQRWADLMALLIAAASSGHQLVDMLATRSIGERRRAVGSALAFLQTRPAQDLARFANGALPRAAHAACWALICIAR